MPFTIEWPLLAREETSPSASSYPASRQFLNTATFFYDAAEWDGIESIRLEVVARGQRGVQVTFNYQSRADNQYDTAEAILSGTGFAPEGQTVTHILSATTTSQGGVQVTFYHVWELTNNGTNVTCTLTLSSYVAWGGTFYNHESTYTVTVPVGGSAGTSFTVVRNTEPTVVVEVGGTVSSTATQPCKFALCPVSSTTPVVEFEFHTNSPQRQVSGNISLTSGTEYVLKAINGDPNAVVYGARLLIKQSSATTKTIVPYEIGAYFEGASGAYIDISPLAYYLHKASDWGGTVAIRFEAELRTSSNTTTAYAALATTGNTVVAEVSTTSTTTVRLRSSPISLSDNTKYKVRVKNSLGVYTTLSSARVLVFVQSPTKLSIPRSVMEVVSGIGTTPKRSVDFIAYDPADYQGVTLAAAPAQYMLSAASSDTVTGRLWDGAATSRQVTSGTSATDLYVSAAESLPSTAKNFQLEAVSAYGYSPGGTARFVRLMVLCTFSTVVTRVVSLRAVVQKAQQYIVPIRGVVYKTFQQAGSVRAAISKPVQRSASVRAAVLRIVETSATLRATVQRAQFAANPIRAAVQRAQFTVGSIRAALAAVVGRSTTIRGLVRATRQVQASARGAVMRMASVATTIRAALFQRYSRSTTVRGLVLAVRSVQVVARGLTMKSSSVAATLRAALFQRYFGSTVIRGLVSAVRTTQAVARGLILGRFDRVTTLRSVVARVYNRSASVRGLVLAAQHVVSSLRSVVQKSAVVGLPARGVIGGMYFRQASVRSAVRKAQRAGVVTTALVRIRTIGRQTVVILVRPTTLVPLVPERLVEIKSRAR